MKLPIQMLSVILFLVFFGIPVLGSQNDEVYSWISESKQYSESGPELTMNLGFNEGGLPIVLNFYLKNVYNSPIKILFPKDPAAFARNIIIAQSSAQQHVERVDILSYPMVERFQEILLTPGEQINWDFGAHELVQDMEEYTQVEGFLSVRFSSLLYLDTTTLAQELSDYERLRERIVWNGNVKGGEL